MEYKNIAILFASSLTIGTMIEVTALKAPFFTHFFDWVFIYYLGTLSSGLMYLYKSKQTPKEEQVQLLYKAEVVDKKILKVPFGVWIKLSGLSFFSTIFGILGFILLLPFVFIMITSIQILSLYLVLYIKNQTPIKLSRNLIGLLTILVGQITVGISGAVIKEWTESTAAYDILGIVFALLFVALDNIYVIQKKYFIDQYFVEATQYNFHTSCLQVPLMIIALIILQYVECPNDTKHLCSPNGTNQYFEQTNSFFTNMFDFASPLPFITLLLVLLLSIPTSIYEYNFTGQSTPFQRVSANSLLVAFLSVFYMIINHEKAPESDTWVALGATIMIIGVLILQNVIKISQEDYQETKLNPPAEQVDISEVS